MKNSHELEQVMNSIADAMQVDLKLNGSTITGSEPMEFTCEKLGLRVPFEVEVRGSFSTPKGSWCVMFHVSGDLYLAAYSSLREKGVYVIVIDGAKFASDKEREDLFWEHNVKTWDKMIELLDKMKAKRQIFFRRWYGKEWAMHGG